MSLFTDVKNNKNQNFDTSAHQFDAFINVYLSELDNKSESFTDKFRIALIATSPAVEVSKAIVRHASEFSKRNIKVRAIFSSLDPKEDLLPWLKDTTLLSNSDWLEDIRWANKRELMDAHEQIILGPNMCWSGDAMRRQSRAPFHMDLFENNCEVKTRMGRLAFEALWSVSVAVPNSKYRQSNSSHTARSKFPITDYSIFDRRSGSIPTRH